MENEEKRDSVRAIDPTISLEPTPPPQPEIPPEPPMDPRYGDKTPAYAEWLFKFFPDKAAKQYAGRKIMGRKMPAVINPASMVLPDAGSVILPKQGGDIPESSMEKEAPEQWVHR
jgi:hypothetical protein